MPTPSPSSRDATPGHMVSFSVVPVHWRVLYVNIVSIGFGTFMSRMVAALGWRDLSVLCSRVRDHWGIGGPSDLVSAGAGTAALSMHSTHTRCSLLASTHRTPNSNPSVTAQIVGSWQETI